MRAICQPDTSCSSTRTGVCAPCRSTSGDGKSPAPSFRFWTTCSEHLGSGAAFFAVAAGTGTLIYSEASFSRTWAGCCDRFNP